MSPISARQIDCYQESLTAEIGLIPVFVILGQSDVGGVSLPMPKKRVALPPSPRRVQSWTQER